MATRVSSAPFKARFAPLRQSSYPPHQQLLSRFLSAPSSSDPNPDPSPKPSSRPKPYPNYNPRETVNPDPATLRAQWLYASRLFGRWSSYAWGSTALAGAFFFALGWAIKGENPLLSHKEAWDTEKTKETPPP